MFLLTKKRTVFLHLYLQVQSKRVVADDFRFCRHDGHRKSRKADAFSWRHSLLVCNTCPSSRTRAPGTSTDLTNPARLPVFINTLMLHESEPSRGDEAPSLVGRFLPARRGTTRRRRESIVDSLRVVFLSPSGYKSPGFLSGPSTILVTR